MDNESKIDLILLNQAMILSVLSTMTDSKELADMLDRQAERTAGIVENKDL